MTPERIQRSRIVIDGVEVGAAEVAAAKHPSPGPIELELTFRPNWVGIWKLQAALADSRPD